MAPKMMLVTWYVLVWLIISTISESKHHSKGTKQTSLRQAIVSKKDKKHQVDSSVEVHDGNSRDKNEAETSALPVGIKTSIAPLPSTSSLPEDVATKDMVFSLAQQDALEAQAEVSAAKTEIHYTDVDRTAAKFGNFLFDLSTDPYETTNLLEAEDTSQYDETIAYFRKRQKYWASLMKDPEIPVDMGNKYSIFRENNNGYCAYNEVDFEPLAVTTKYSYQDAPHIVFVLIDDWGYNDVGFRSTYMNWTTPTIDQLAREGVILENHYSYELCTPTRGALLTGRYSMRLGQWNENLGELPLNETTLAQELKSAGYKTYMVGKWDLGYSTKKHYPVSRGFDSFYGFYNGMISYWNKTFLNYVDLQTGHNIVTDEEELSEEMHTTYLFQNKVEEAIADHAENYADQPMFMYYATQLIHGPWSAPEVFMKRCADPRIKIDDLDAAADLRNYCALNVMLDEVVTNLTCALNAHGMGDNTMLIIVSDNGGDSNVKYAGNSYPFKGHKGSVFRGGVSTTAIIHSKLVDEEKRGKSFKGNVHITDWLPTLMGLATNGKWQGSLTGADIDGQDVWNAILSGDGSRGHKELVFFVNNNASVLQLDQYKYFYNQYDVGVDESDFVFRNDLNVKKSTKSCTSPSLLSYTPMTSANSAVTSSSHTDHEHRQSIHEEEEEEEEEEESDNKKDKETKDESDEEKSPDDIDFTDQFLSFPVPLDMPKTLSRQAIFMMIVVTIILVGILSMRIYVHNSYAAEAISTQMQRMKVVNVTESGGVAIASREPSQNGYTAII